jgi:hypothetical protein
MNLLVILNFITVLISIVVFIYSVKLIICLNTGFKTGWWTVLPLAFFYAFCNRVFVLLIAMGVYPSTDWSEIIAASTLPFWILIAIFMIGLYYESEKVLCKDL